MFVQVIELAKQIKETGQRSITELPELLRKAEQLAQDDTQHMLTRALAHRAAGNAYPAAGGDQGTAASHQEQSSPTLQAQQCKRNSQTP